MKTLLQMEMYYVTEYTPTCRFLNIINSTLTDPLIIFKNLQLECILHFIKVILETRRANYIVYLITTFFTSV
jgi:hypothetical protein